MITQNSEEGNYAIHNMMKRVTAHFEFKTEDRRYCSISTKTEESNLHIFFLILRNKHGLSILYAIQAKGTDIC